MINRIRNRRRALQSGQPQDVMLPYHCGEFTAVYRCGIGLSTLNRRVSCDHDGVMSRKPKQMAESTSDKTIVLIGLMGAGKSAIGRRLAARLGLPFVDADSEVELAAGCSIEDIFSLHGEAAFRDGERRVIARLLGGPPQVLATGGGAYMDPETRARIRETAISIWLRADLDVLLNRVSRRDNRPLLKHCDRQKILKQLMAERYPIYAEADITVESRDAPHEAVLSSIFDELARHEGHAPSAADDARPLGRAVP